MLLLLVLFEVLVVVVVVMNGEDGNEADRGEIWLGVTLIDEI